MKGLKYKPSAKLSLYCILSNLFAPLTYRPAKRGAKFSSWLTKEIVCRNSDYFKSSVTWRRRQLCAVPIAVLNSQLMSRSPLNRCRGSAQGQGSHAEPRAAVAALQWGVRLEGERGAGSGGFCKQDSTLWQRDTLLEDVVSCCKGAGSPATYLVLAGRWEIYNVRVFSPGRAI